MKECIQLNKQVFGTLNGLRGVAALIVVAFHWSLYDTLHLQNGWLAVDLFFVLSGFVIAHAYEARLLAGLSFRDFLIIRLVRLYPLYVLGICLPILILLMSYILKRRIIEEQLVVFQSIPFSVLMLPTPPFVSDLKQAKIFPMNTPAWSLFFELAINIAYALSVRFWTEFRLFIILIGAGLALSLSYFLNVSLDGGWSWANVDMGAMRVIYSFSAGVLIYKFHQREIFIPTIPVYMVIVLFVGLIMLPFHWGPLFSMVVGFPLLVAVAAKTEPRGLQSSVFATLGAASYAIYALHQPLHALITAVFDKLHLPLGLPVDIVLLSLIVPICVAVDSLYDAPTRKYLSGLLLRPVKTSKPQVEYL